MAMKAAPPTPAVSSGTPHTVVLPVPIALLDAMSLGAIMCSPANATVAPYTRTLLDIERRFDNCRAFSLLSDHWTVCFPCIAAYLATIFGGRALMRRRAPFQLRGALLFWNIALASYSGVATWRMLPAALYSIRTFGLLATSCGTGTVEEREAMGLWIFLFIVSKIVEFGDTAFIVLRKQPLRFLHWYHHVTVAFFVWSAGAYASPMQTYFSTVNVLVHSVMYSYYALKVLRVRVPRAVSMTITVLQLMQMVLGILITWYMYRAKAADRSCAVAEQGIAIAACIYASYFVLFLNYFVRTYWPRKTDAAAKKLT